MTAPMDQDQAQRHTVSTLMLSQVLSGVGLSAGATVGSLLAEKVSGRTELAGLGGTFQVLGSALIALPLAQIAHRSGRRPSLTFGYILGALGAVLLVGSSVLNSFVVLLVGSVLLGSGTAANSAARYAATDLARPQRRGRDLSLVIWVTTLGSVLGPNLVGPATPLARALGLDVLTGPFLISAVALVVGAGLLWGRLRPDPLLLGRKIAGVVVEGPKGSIGRGMRAIATSVRARVGVLTMSLGHAVMVSVMVMTPLHMVHGHAELRIVGFVLSGHILGMFAFSPLMGMAVDRFGAPAVALGGGLTQVLATLLAGLAAQGYSHVLAIALFLLGLGWSATLVSGSTLLVAAVPVGERAGAQGASDLVMGLAAAVGGALAGVIVEMFGYARLAHLATVVAAVIVVGALVVIRPSAPKEPDPTQDQEARIR